MRDSFLLSSYFAHIFCLLRANCMQNAKAADGWVERGEWVASGICCSPESRRAVRESPRSIAWHTESWAPMLLHRPAWRRGPLRWRDVAWRGIACRRMCPKCPPANDNNKLRYTKQPHLIKCARQTNAKRPKYILYYAAYAWFFKICHSYATLCAVKHF